MSNEMFISRSISTKHILSKLLESSYHD